MGSSCYSYVLVSCQRELKENAFYNFSRHSSISDCLNSGILGPEQTYQN